MKENEELEQGLPSQKYQYGSYSKHNKIISQH